MLVLSRKLGQSIVINNGEIVITVQRIRGQEVRLSIDAPPEFHVRREELPPRDERGGKSRKKRD